jgi:mRNA interferase HigB
MRIISRKTLKDYCSRHRKASSGLTAWFAEAKKAKWSNPNQIKMQYVNASIIGNNRVVFYIKGNEYRLVVKIHYNTHVLYIRFIGTHEEYNHIDAETI